MRTTPELAVLVVLAAALCWTSVAIDVHATTLPDPPQIVSHYARALGGEKALRRHSSATMRGMVQTAKGEKLAFVYYAAAPYLRLEKVSLPDNKGDVSNGYDGKIAWTFDPRSGAQLATGDDLQSAKRDADFYYPLDELTWFRSMVTVGVVTYEGRRCYHLHGVNNWGRWNDHFYEVGTGLLAGYEFEVQLPDGPRIVHEIFSGYHSIDGVLVPMQQTVRLKSKTGDGWSVLETVNYAHRDV